MKHQTLLAIDYGEKKLGLALKESGHNDPIPFMNIKNKLDVVGKIVRIVKERKINLVIIGYPIHSSGKKSQMTLNVEKFVKDLGSCLPSEIKVDLFNEAWTTQEAIQKLRLLGKKDRYIQAKKDIYSAVLILEKYLSQM